MEVITRIEVNNKKMIYIQLVQKSSGENILYFLSPEDNEIGFLNDGDITMLFNLLVNMNEKNLTFGDVIDIVDAYGEKLK